MTRIFHLATSLEGGGTENFLHQILAHSVSGYDHRVFYLKKDGVIGERIRASRIPVQSAGSFFALHQRMKTEKPALIHTCLYSAHQVGRLLGRLTQTPVVTSQRSIDIWQKPWQTVLDRWTLPLSAAVIANSRAAADVIQLRRGTRSRPEIIEIPNGIDPARFKPGNAIQARERYALPSDAIVGGSLMRLHREKGTDFFPEFAQRLLMDHPRLHFLIGGVGPLEQTVKSQLAGKPYGDRIHWIGWENDTPTFLAACDFFWSLSREESFPQTLVEASAVGLPWIAPDTGGIQDLLASGAIGRPYPRLEIAEAVEQTRALIQDLRPAQDQARLAASRIQTSYSLAAMVEKVYRVFDRYAALSLTLSTAK